jgi:hypothetical protein
VVYTNTGLFWLIALEAGKSKCMMQASAQLPLLGECRRATGMWKGAELPRQLTHAFKEGLHEGFASTTKHFL